MSEEKRRLYRINATSHKLYLLFKDLKHLLPVQGLSTPELYESMRRAIDLLEEQEK